MSKPFWLTDGDELFNGEIFYSLAEAKIIIESWRRHYNTIRYDKRRYRRRNQIEIMFGRLKDSRRISTRYDRCAKTFLSAVALAATVMFWL